MFEKTDQPGGTVAVGVMNDTYGSITVYIIMCSGIYLLAMRLCQ